MTNRYIQRKGAIALYIRIVRGRLTTPKIQIQTADYTENLFLLTLS